MLEAALARMRKSPTARRLEKRRRRFEPVIVSFGEISESTSTSIDSDLLGRTHYDDTPPWIVLNERLIVSTRTLTETAAHELFGHDLIVPESRRTGADVSWLLENEAFSLAVGNLVALEAGEGTVDEDSIDWIAESTDTYRAEFLFKDSPAGIQLSLAEARDPCAAIAARLSELSRRRRSVEIRRKDMAVWNFELAHLEKEHGLDRLSVKDLQDDIDVWTSTIIPWRQALLDVAEPHLKTVQAWFEEPEGQAWVAELIAISTNPYSASLEAEWAGLGRSIAGARARLPRPPEAPPAPVPAVKQLTWDDVSALVKEDKEKNPNHWKDAPETEDPVDWIVK